MKERVKSVFIVENTKYLLFAFKSVLSYWVEYGRIRYVLSSTG